MIRRTIDPETVGIRMELGLNHNGFIAFLPDLDESGLELVKSALPAGAYQDFRYSHTGPNFSLVELALQAAGMIARSKELISIAEGVAATWGEKRGIPTYVNPTVHLLGDVPLLENVFFSKLQGAETDGQPVAVAA